MSVDVYEVVKKLIGEIEPVGETHTDDTRFKNLKVMCALMDQLYYDISEVIPNKERVEFSMKRAGEYANAFLNERAKNVD